MDQNGETIKQELLESNASTQDTVASNFKLDSLESIRKRLLDLTARNSLLNYRHPKAGCVRVIDELPDQIYEVLQDSKKLTFIPVPEPTEAELIKAGFIKIEAKTQQKIVNYPSAEQWARHKGINTSYDLPEVLNSDDGRHQDANIQTLLYAPELEARLRSIRASAESAIEESGANILYLALGFLEWYESRESEQPRLAPLFTIPVHLERSDLDRKLGAYRYTITIKDEGLISNITLREKLSNDFGLILPVIDDETLPESYFNIIKNTILEHQPKWRIRRQATLVQLNFSKQAMYQDLDPKNWPAHANIQDHPLIKLFFASQAEENSGEGFSYQAEHKIDEIDDIHEQYPLIYDADSSQHSAVIDVINGKSLVIEGPPGSGKSQTITNLIAACIANGQKVLFVAEKMAALNVVKSRLDKAHLGDFCLELHSHKTNKLKILGDLATRLAKQDQYISPNNIDADIARYEDHKEKLNSYVAKVNSIWGNTGQSIHQILQKATRLREELNIKPERLLIEGINGETATSIRQSELIDYSKMLENIYIQVSKQSSTGSIKDHFWHGVERINFDAQGINDFWQALKSWNNELERLLSEWRNYLKQYLNDNIDAPSLSDIDLLIEKLEALPTLMGGELLGITDYLSSEHQKITRWVSDYETLHTQIGEFQSIIHDQKILDAATTKSIIDVVAKLKSIGLDGSTQISAVFDDHQETTRLLDINNQIENDLTLIREHSPSGLLPIFGNTYNSLKELPLFISCVAALPRNLWKVRDELLDDDEIDELLAPTEEALAVLYPLKGSLEEQIDLSRLPSAEHLKNLQSVIEGAGIFKWLSSQYREARKSLFSLSRTVRPNKLFLLEQLPLIVKYATTHEQLDRLHALKPALGRYYQGVDTDLTTIKDLRQWYKNIRSVYGSGFGERVKVGGEVRALNTDFALALVELADKGFKGRIEQSIVGLESLIKKYSNHELSHHRNHNLVGQEGQLSRLNTDLEIVTNTLVAIFKDGSKTIADLEPLSEQHNEFISAATGWTGNAYADSLQPFGKKLSIWPGEFSQLNIDVIKNSLRIAETIHANQLLSIIFEQSPDEFTYKKMIEGVRDLRFVRQSTEELKANFSKLGAVNIPAWLKGVSDESLSSLVDRNSQALTNRPWLQTWLDYVQLKHRLFQQGLQNLVSELESSEIPPENLHKVVELCISFQLAQEIFSKHPDLAQFTGLEQNAIRERFKEYDFRLLNLHRKKVAYKASRVRPPAGIGIGRVGDFTEVALINKEVGKKTRHIAVRALMKRAGKAIQTLKPCFMMSPMSVAQYLEPGIFDFDLVVMDEASQIKPEDALGAIARGRKLVVVGDPKQLPPTSFFQKAVDGDGDSDDDDNVSVQDSESILESVMPMFNTRRLRWHYRSKHESLIAFSNKNFYDSDLVLFPSPFQASNEFGVKLHHITRGRFVNRRNVEEAQEIVRAAINHLLERSHESLGIVAMNIQQREEIEKQLEQQVKDNPQLKHAYETNLQSEEPLFIKNLENVQGDERDVIYISITYGPEQVGGKPMQRFGPINADVGWRRLNVLFTRSKKRMHIFTSMTSADITPGPGSSRGVTSLKAFLEYTETGHLHSTNITGKPADSDFEIAVMQLLKQHGYECEPQLGVAGFFLDLAVRDPGKPGRFLMGIECDGATYHSAKSARDRDYLRQKILEDLGWKIRRIWSTDWFKHPQAQIQPILHELESLRTYPESTSQNAEEPIGAVEVLNDEELNLPQSILEISSDKGDVDVRAMLLAFDKMVIREEFPKTDLRQRLLRDEMLDLLLELKPTSKAEFQEMIPGYLRSGTATYEAKFLDDVLSIIADYA
ncbi:DUF4011 domain-containing anti-phage protein Hhe [Methylobacillus pratensis]